MRIGVKLPDFVFKQSSCVDHRDGQRCPLLDIVGDMCICRAFKRKIRDLDRGPDQLRVATRLPECIKSEY